jgi:LysM repeat protein
VISAGATLSGIVQRYGVSMKELQEKNSLEGSRIRVGQVLKTPQGS